MYLATFVAEIPPRLLEAKERAEQAWAKEAEVLGDKIYELPADLHFPEYWEYVAALREAQRRSILNCYENDVGYQVALKEELAHWGFTPEEFFADRRLGGEMRWRMMPACQGLLLVMLACRKHSQCAATPPTCLLPVIVGCFHACCTAL